MYSAGYAADYLSDCVYEQRAMWVRAAHSGSLQIAQWIAAHSSFWGVGQAATCCIAAARACCINLLDWAYAEYLKLYARMMEADCSRSLVLHVARAAAYHCFGEDTGSVTDNVYAAAAHAGCDAVLRWAWDRGLSLPSDTGTLTTSAASNGRLSTLRWLRSRGCKWEESPDRGACSRAWSRGFNEVAMWAMSNGAPCTAKLRAQINLGPRIHPRQLLEWRGHTDGPRGWNWGWECDDLSHGSLCSVCVCNKELPAILRNPSECKCCPCCPRQGSVFVEHSSAPSTAHLLAEHTPALAALLNDPSSTIRRSALLTLSRVEIGAFLQHSAAIAACVLDPNKWVKATATSVIHRIDAARLPREHAAVFIPPLVQALKDSNDSSVCSATIDALGNLGPSQFAEIAAALASKLSDRDRAVQDAALRHLHRLTSEDLAPLLPALIENLVRCPQISDLLRQLPSSMLQLHTEAVMEKLLRSDEGRDYMGTSCYMPDTYLMRYCLDPAAVSEYATDLQKRWSRVCPCRRKARLAVSLGMLC